MSFNKVIFLLIISALVLVVIPQPAFASEVDKGDTAWMLVATLLVILMTVPGLALFYGGLGRKENVLATVMQTFMTLCVVSITWVAVGYSLVFSEGNQWFGGFDYLFLNHITTDSVKGTIPESVFAMFQLTFAAISTALILGAVADRIRFLPMVLFGAIWSLVVYAPIAHMVWGGGLMASHGGLLGFGEALDFAGGTVVHINAGIAGLVCAAVLGNRKKQGEDTHNLVLGLIGASLLWVGWFGFNAGSALTAGQGAGMAMLTTQVATAVAVLSWVMCDYFHRGKPSVVGAISGAVSGLVGITPAAGFVDVSGAFIIGISAGVICHWATFYFKHKFPIDDSLDVFSIHCIGGIVGALLTGVLAKEAIGGTPGWIEGNFDQVIAQALSILFTLVYSGVLSFIILKTIRIFVRLRVREEEELKGLDVSLHGEQLP